MAVDGVGEVDAQLVQGEACDEGEEVVRERTEVW